MTNFNIKGCATSKPLAARCTYKCRYILLNRISIYGFKISYIAFEGKVYNKIYCIKVGNEGNDGFFSSLFLWLIKREITLIPSLTDKGCAT